MKASECRLLDLLDRTSQFAIPIYQRTYSWTERECRQLWDDVLRCGSDERIVVHFVGSIVYIENGLSQVSVRQPYLVIDGQQRLTTVVLLLAALVHSIGDEIPVDGFSRKRIRHKFLIDPDEDDERKYKLLLTQTDRESLMAIVDERELPKDRSLHIEENFRFFKNALSEGVDPAIVCRGLSKLVVVDVALSRDTDNPQLIFESMNSTGRELSQADLIRNFVLMGIDPTVQVRLYRDYWRPMELEFGQQAYVDSFDAFMRHFLTMRTGEIPNIDEVYGEFKRYAQRMRSEHPVRSLIEHTEDLVRELRRYARFYCAMALPTPSESNRELQSAFEDLRDLKSDVAYPLLMAMYARYEQGKLSCSDFAGAIRLIESYMLRRIVCGIPTQGTNKLMAELVRLTSDERCLENLQARLFALQGARRLPDDAEFRRALQERDLYNVRFRSYLLRRLENHGRKERVVFENYTIEHIMPQTENLNRAWRRDLGGNYKEIHGKYLHTLGNLTLTGYNSEYSDRSFAEKRDMRGGFRESPLSLNKGLGSLNAWNEASIIERARRLSDIAANVWPIPAIADATFAAQRLIQSRRTEYTYDDHRYLKNSAMHDLFMEFRKAVLAFDPSVTEEILKQYVAFKYDTNFVDVVPQAKRLRLELNMPFHEIRDSRGMCEDVSGKGHWGNGDVEVSLTSLDDLPYVLGLVRQSFERQLGSDV